MRFYILLVLLILLNCSTSIAQSDWIHEKVYKLNVLNSFITKGGNLVYRRTNNSSLKQATYYEYFNDRLYVITTYILTEKNRPLYITFRGNAKTNEFTQIVETQSNPSPSYSSTTISINQKKEIVNNGVISGVYRRGNFIDLLYLKTVNGELLLKN